MNAALFSSKKKDYCTPQDLFNKLNEEFNFSLDAAATDKSAKCKKYYTPECDGLKNSWEVKSDEAVFCNPPYGRNITGKWVQKAYEEAKNGTTIVLLIPARTDTRWFHDYIYGQANIRFLKGRVMFTDEDGNPCRDKNGKPAAAPFPSMIVIYNGMEGGGY